MKSSLRSLSFASATLWGLIGSGLASAQEAAPAAKPEVRQVQVRVVTHPELKVTALAPNVGEYWVGIQLGEVTDALKAQLEIESGLLIREVMPDSPARKAELKVFDIIIAIGDKPVREPADLIAAVNESKENELALTIVRSGKKQTLQITPAKRPAEAAGQDPPPADLASRARLDPKDVQQLDALLRRLEIHPNGQSVVLWSLGQPQDAGGRGVWELGPQTKSNQGSAPVQGAEVAEFSKKLDAVLQRLEKLQADVDGLKNVR